MDIFNWLIFPHLNISTVGIMKLRVRKVISHHKLRKTKSSDSGTTRLTFTVLELFYGRWLMEQNTKILSKTENRNLRTIS